MISQQEFQSVPSVKEWDVVLDEMLQRAEAGAPYMLGYPVSTNLKENCSEKFKNLLAYHWQQGPDPFLMPPIIPYAANARNIERGVVNFMMDLYKGKDCWGYVASGGHESNRSALLVARNKFPDGIVYFSKEAHFGIPNLIDELRMPHQKEIAVHQNGEMNVDALMSAIDKDKPVILVITLGTTMTGAIDNVRTIIARLDEAGITDRYIHCDAALHGSYLPFLKETADINFAALPIHSLAVSPYKAWGAPVPNSVFLVNKPLFMERSVGYIMAEADKTKYIPASSRSGLISIGAMDGLVRAGGITGMRAETKRRMELTKYAVSKLKEIGIDAFSNPNSTIIVINNFPMNLQFIEYWQLKLEGNKASVVVSGHFTQNLIDEFVNELHKVAKEFAKFS
ncbi:MAG: pyridoxal-dependent decarboxylase [Gammaproteobacteria bacterium]|jgi:histidine decarboxylase